MTRIIKKIPISTNEQGQTVIESTVVLGGGFILPDAIEATISANTDNLYVPDLSNGVLLRINCTGNYDLTGLVPPDITQAGLIFLCNIGTGNLSLKNNSASSIPENRLLMGSNKTVQTNEAAIFVYDTISLRFRMFSVNI